MKPKLFEIQDILTSAGIEAHAEPSRDQVAVFWGQGEGFAVLRPATITLGGGVPRKVVEIDGSGIRKRKGGKTAALRELFRSNGIEIR